MYCDMKLIICQVLYIGEVLFRYKIKKIAEITYVQFIRSETSDRISHQVQLHDHDHHQQMVKDLVKKIDLDGNLGYDVHRHQQNH